MVSPEQMEALTDKVISKEEWSEYESLFFNLAKIVVLQYKDNKSKVVDSLVFVRFQEIQKVTGFFQKLAYIGAYFTLLRELRYVLESILQAHYVEDNYPNISYEGKLAILRERERHNRNVGRKLIADIGLEHDLNSEIHPLYKELSDYVHPTRTELIETTKTMESYGARFVRNFFDEDALHLFKKFFTRVTDMVFYFFISDYRELIPEFVKLKEEIRNKGLRTTLKYLEGHK